MTKDIKNIKETLPEERVDKINKKSENLIRERWLSLAKELTDLDVWTWLPGMLAITWEPNSKNHGRTELRVEGSRDLEILSRWKCVPDLQDAATLGATLRLVRNLWGDHTICNIYDSTDKNWCCGIWDDGLLFRGQTAPSEAESLISSIKTYSRTFQLGKDKSLTSKE
jgi:hypothetical protein